MTELLISRPDDSAVPRLESGKGWAHKRSPLGDLIFMAPDGETYTRAHPMEKADLIAPAARGLPEWRLVHWEGSSAQRGENRTLDLAAGRTRRQQARRKNHA